jgi:hypothetical protein
MPNILKQIPVTVTITGTANHSPVTYSYIQPPASIVTNSPTCILQAAEPYNVVFALDYASSNAGWQFATVQPVVAKIVNGARSQLPTLVPSDDHLSLKTVDQSQTALYQFSFNFSNPLAVTTTVSDPQEGNAVVPNE